MANFIRFLGTGPSKPIFWRGKNKRQQTSTLFGLDSQYFLFDASPAIQKQAKWLKKDVPPEASLQIFLTHGHEDAIGGLRGLETMAKKSRWKLSWYAHPHTYTVRKPESQAHSLKPKKPIKFGKVAVTPFLVEHVQAGQPVPTLAYFIKTPTQDIVYCTDICQLTPAAESFFKKASTIIIDGSGWDRPVINHHAIVPFIERAAAWQPQNIIVTHIGRNVPLHNQAQKQLKNIFPHTWLAYDGWLIYLTARGLKPAKNLN